MADYRAHHPSVEQRSFNAAGGGNVVIDGNSPASLELPRLRAFSKRCFDIVFATLGLLILSPLILMTALIVKVTSRGSVLYWQERFGQNGSRFHICKFRTMYADRCDRTGKRQTVSGDPRVTPVGRVLRRRSVDELPQFLNVLMGTMSLVGPRAHSVGMTVGDVEYEKLVENYHLRHCVRPGITGLAQVRGLRGPVLDGQHARARVEADLEYIARQSLWLDVVILVRTALMEISVGTGDDRPARAPRPGMHTPSLAGDTTSSTSPER